MNAPTGNLAHRCTWCECLAPPNRKPPPPAGFCSDLCAAYYRAACADLGAELHRTGAISIQNLRRRLNRIARGGPPADHPGVIHPASVIFCVVLVLLAMLVRHALAHG